MFSNTNDIMRSWTEYVPQQERRKTIEHATLEASPNPSANVYLACESVCCVLTYEFEKFL